MCVFCEIINHNIPSKVVYEDEESLAILDLSQTTYGHTLLMPKKHYDNFLEIPNDEYQKLMSKAQIIGQQLINKLDAKGMNLLINTNKEAGQSVNHLHVHLIPRYSINDSIKLEFVENKYDLDEVLSKIKA